MKRFFALVLFVPLLAIGKPECESGHSIELVDNDGAVIFLKDGSVWDVVEDDAIISYFWPPESAITICPGRLINTEDVQQVTAKRRSENESNK